MSDIHTNLKELRIEKGFTQEEVADKIGLTRQAISAYEGGKRQPGVDILMKFAEIYEVNLEDILYGTNEAQKGRQRVKYAAIIVAFLFLTLQILMGTLSIMSQVFYPMEDGYSASNGVELEVMNKHFELAEKSEQAEYIARAVISLGTIVVLVLDLREKGAFRWQTKVGSDTFYECYVLLGH